MQKTFVLFLLPVFLLLGLISTAQTISGTVADTTNKKNISNAVVALLKPVDSILYTFTRSNNAGNFEVKDLQPGKYILLITHPLFADYIDDIEVPEGGLQLKSISVTPKSKLLEEVIIKTGSPIRIKGDTTEYTADSFKVRENANVEELLKKLPGIQVGKDGTIKAMGEKVTKVLVDGEEFFGDDPGIAVKNLRADAVDKVQVFDKKSDQAEFTGIDDGQKDKTINLKLKEDKKKGYFGKISASGGLKDNYNNTAMINAFKAKRKLAAYGIMSNTGKTNLDWDESQNYGDGTMDGMSMDFSDDGGMYMDFNGGDDSYQGGKNGIPKNWNAGLHYSDKLSEKEKINAGYKFSKVNALGTTTIYSKTFLPDTSWNNNTTIQSFTSKIKHAFNLAYDLNIDSLNSIKWTAKFNNSNNRSSNLYNTAAIDNNGNLINRSKRNNNTKTDNNSVNGTMLWKHKFKKPFRTLSVNTDFTWTQVKNNGFLLSYNDFYKGGILSQSDTVDQQNIKDNNTNEFNTKIAYTEPLFKDAFMELNYSLGVNNNNNDRISNARDNTGKYTQQIDSLTNAFKFNRLVNKPGINFRYNKKKASYSIGTAVGFSHFVQQNITLNKKTVYDFVNYFPSARVNFKMNGNKNLQFSYNGSATAPALEQLQPINDNTDPFNIYEGNPDLKQSFRHKFNLNYGFYNVLKEEGFWSGFNITSTENNFSQFSSIDTARVRHYKTVNVNGVYNISFYGNYYHKFKKSGFYVNLSPNITNSRNVDFVNEQKNSTTNASYGMEFGFGKYVDKKYNFSIRPKYSYNHSVSSINVAANIDYWQLGAYADAAVTLPGKIEVGTDIQFEARQKDPRFPQNNNYTLWNASIGRKFIKNTLEVELGVNDILEQNRGFNRNFSSYNYTETYYNTLRRYWMLTVSWNFSQNGKPAEF